MVLGNWFNKCPDSLKPYFITQEQFHFTKLCNSTNLGIIFYLPVMWITAGLLLVMTTMYIPLDKKKKNGKK